MFDASCIGLEGAHGECVVDGHIKAGPKLRRRYFWHLHTEIAVPSNGWKSERLYGSNLAQFQLTVQTYARSIEQFGANLQHSVHVADVTPSGGGRSSKFVGFWASIYLAAVVSDGAFSYAAGLMLEGVTDSAILDTASTCDH